MNTQENLNNFSKKNLTYAIKMRSIWTTQLKTENALIRAMLNEAFFPYFIFINKYFGNIKPGYEIEACINITDKIKLDLASATKSATTPEVQISFYFVPLISEDDLEITDINFELIPIEFNKRQMTYVTKILKKFSMEIELPVHIIYE